MVSARLRKDLINRSLHILYCLGAALEAFVLFGAGFPPIFKVPPWNQSPKPARLASLGWGEPVPRICSEWLRQRTMAQPPIGNKA